MLYSAARPVHLHDGEADEPAPGAVAEPVVLQRAGDHRQRQRDLHRGALPEEEAEEEEEEEGTGFMRLALHGIFSPLVINWSNLYRQKQLLIHDIHTTSHDLAQAS